MIHDLNPNRGNVHVRYSPGPLMTPQWLHAPQRDGSMLANAIGGQTIMEWATVQIGAALLTAGWNSVNDDASWLPDLAAKMAADLLAAARQHDPFFSPPSSEAHNGVSRQRRPDVPDSPDSATEAAGTDQERSIKGDGADSAHN